MPMALLVASAVLTVDMHCCLFDCDAQFCVDFKQFQQKH